jgi:hydroxymethylbilane synthase
VEELHGNVDTRLRKLEEGELDAIVLAAAGLRRLGREAEIGFAIPTDRMVPAAGQGALALQVRAGDEATSDATAAINDLRAMRELTAERTVVALLEATCASPLGAHARIEGERIAIDAFVGLPDGSDWVRDRLEGDAEQPALAGAELVQRLLGAGAREILDRAETADS